MNLLGQLARISMAPSYYGLEGEDVAIETRTADKFLHKYLRNGGSREMNVNGSSTAVNFDYVVPANDEAYIARCNILMLDATPIPTEFGGVAALSNGILIQVLDDGGSVLKGFNDDDPIIDNNEFNGLAGTDVEYVNGTGDDSVITRWTLQRHSGGPLLRLRAGETFRVIVRDDLTGITRFRWAIQGHSLL